MQSALLAADRSHDYTSTKGHPYLTSQDPGLGIRADEHNFLSYDPFNPDHADFGPFENDSNAIGNGCRSELASPFDEHFFTSGPGWGFSDGPTMFSNVARTPYSSTPDRYMYSNSVGFGPAQYMTPQSTLNNTPSHYVPTLNGQFKRPMIRHNSTSCVVPQTTLSMDFPSTTGMEASSCQWTSPCETPLWQEISSHCEDSSHMPSVMLDYVGYGNVDDDSHMEESESGVHTPMTGPTTRRKPHLRSSLSESCVPRSLSPSRMRAMSMSQHLHPSTEPQYVGNMLAPQMPLPPLPPSILVKTPHLQVQTPMYATTPTQMYRKSRSMSNTPQRLRRPSSPPASDLNNPNSPFLAPVRQDPTFPGDLYTPRYKRRTSTGRWEGWCGYCQPGRWLDLKNSRFWEDKLRNHGICAKTKLKFAEPERIRWVNMDGKVCQTVGGALEVGDQGTDQKKREGLCGVCGTWVPMDGMRTKARDRAVGWWMHAYKVC